MSFVHGNEQQGVSIHGYEPSPLFNEQDPYWEVHNNSAFAPQPNQYTRLNNNTMIMNKWIYNRTAWLLQSQVGPIYEPNALGSSVFSGEPAGHGAQLTAHTPVPVQQSLWCANMLAPVLHAVTLLTTYTIGWPTCREPMAWFSPQGMAIGISVMC